MTDISFIAAARKETMSGNGWNTGAWVSLLDTFEAEAQRRCRYDVRKDEFVVCALIRITTGIAVSLAVAEGIKAIESSYRRYLRRRKWVADAIAN